MLSKGMSASHSPPKTSPILQHTILLPAGAQLMRKLRVSQELAGSPIMSMSCHPGGHHLMALAR